MSAPARSEFAAVLRSFRQRAALTQEELAERAGLAVNAVGSLERGVRTKPYPHTVRALAAGLGLDETGRAQLVAAAVGHRPEAPAGGPGIIGREVEAERVAALLGSGRARLVTLTGPGGVGKTTLAKAVAARLNAEFREPATVVDASAIGDPALVLATLAAAFGLPGSAAPLDALVQRLRGRPTLVLLDNLEQVVEVGPSLATLVERCPALRLLATSRAPLRIRAEYEVIVPPLTVPDTWLPPDVSTVGASPAVQLFLERCAAMGAPVELTPRNAGDVAELCRRVDGLPLAIELVAAQARGIPFDTLLSRLGQALDRPGPRDLPERQRTLRATLEWSLSLVGERERETFFALAVCSGSFTLDAAEAIVGAATDTVFVLSELVGQSLLATEPTERYRLLEPVRQHAVRSTPASRRDKHARYYLELARDTWHRLRSGDLATALDAVELDQANYLAAHLQLVNTGRHADAVDLVHGITLGVLLRGRSREWRDQLDQSRSADLPPRAQGHYAIAAGQLDYALARREHAVVEMIEGHRRTTEAGDELVAADAAVFASLASLNIGDVEQAARLADATRSRTDPWAGTMRALADGQLSILAGDLQTADVRLSEAGRAALSLGNPLLICMTLNMRATVAERQGDLAETCRLLVDSVEECVAVRMHWPLAFALPGLAGVAMRLDRPQVAGRLLGAAASFTGTSDLLGIFPASRERSKVDIEQLRLELGGRFDETVDAGRLLYLDEVARLARTLVAPRL